MTFLYVSVILLKKYWGFVMKRIEPKTKESLVKLNNVFLNENELKYIRSIQIKKSQKQLPLPHSHLVEIFKR